MHHHNGGDGILKILALETSAKSVSAAVTDGGVVRAYTYQNTGLTHSRTLMPLVDAMLRESEQSLADMDLLAVAAGPGSFTGLPIVPLFLCCQLADIGKCVVGLIMIRRGVWIQNIVGKEAA